MDIGEVLAFEDRPIDELLDLAREGFVAADAYELLRGELRQIRDKTYRAFLNSTPTHENLVRFWAELRGLELLAQQILAKAARGEKAFRLLQEQRFVPSGEPPAGERSE